MDEINLNTYEAIASEFSTTRAYVWKCVKDFCSLMQDNTTILEVGCGNGKNMEYLNKHKQIISYGIDTCLNFVEHCKSKNLNVRFGNSLNIPYQNESFDCMICIAMFHHLLSEEDRNQSMNEILRIMKKGALGMITCWAIEQPEITNFTFEIGINLVPWKGRKGINKTRYYYVYNEKIFREFFMKYESQIEIKNIYNEVGNWIILFKKL
jgi:ubiquinone/menaquinone biosynthesis C-methylase UbiE